MKRFEGRSIFVTGAGHGIGRATALRLSREGAGVSVTDLDLSAAEGVAKELTDLGGTAFGLACNVLVNTAGGDDPNRPEGLDEETIWDTQINLNLTGVMRCINAALPHLVKSPVGGNVVAIGSINGIAAFGGYPYSAAKAGLQNLAKNLRRRLRQAGRAFQRRRAGHDPHARLG